MSKLKQNIVNVDELKDVLNLLESDTRRIDNITNELSRHLCIQSYIVNDVMHKLRGLESLFFHKSYRDIKTYLNTIGLFKDLTKLASMLYFTSDMILYNECSDTVMELESVIDKAYDVIETILHNYKDEMMENLNTKEVFDIYCIRCLVVSMIYYAEKITYISPEDIQLQVEDDVLSKNKIFDNYKGVVYLNRYHSEEVVKYNEKMKKEAILKFLPCIKEFNVNA